MRLAARSRARGAGTNTWLVAARPSFPRGAENSTRGACAPVQPRMDTDKNARGAHPPSGVAGCASQPAVVRAELARTLGWLRPVRVFREARKTARGARALPCNPGWARIKMLGEHTRPRVWRDAPRSPQSCARSWHEHLVGCGPSEFSARRGKQHAGRVRSPATPDGPG